jgi:glyoxylase-like metal-dependent hydrolase (beta-lactamase superfamily II)
MANAAESELHYVFGDALPGAALTIEVAPGVRWLRMPLPFVLDHINLWLLRDRDDDGRDGWAVVDCGVDSPATRAVWQQVFDTQLDGLPVLRVVCTHMHPDHIGLAHWLAARFDCRLWVSASDWSSARSVSSAPCDAHCGDAAADFFARHGLADSGWLHEVRARPNHYASLVPAVPSRFRRLLHGQRLSIGANDWRCIAGYGHSPEHIALHCAALNLLIAGDMVLPRISTNVSVMEFEPEANPLELYLSSIEALRALPGDTLVLPSHGKPFTGLHRRIDQLRRHHDERFAEVLNACARSPRSAADLLPVLFPRALDLQQTTFAIGEAIAHLHALLERRQLRAVASGDGVSRFATVGEP